MSFKFNDKDLGSWLELVKAWQHLKGEWPQLLYVPQTGEDDLPEWYIKAVKEQAKEALKTAKDAHTKWILEQLIE